jgi:hypothetical protein
VVGDLSLEGAESFQDIRQRDGAEFLRRAVVDIAHQDQADILRRCGLSGMEVEENPQL